MEEQRVIFQPFNPEKVSPPFFEYQLDDIYRACVLWSERKGIYLGHEMGCGKTVIAAGIIRWFLVQTQARRWFRVLILVPGSGAKGVWRAAMPEWCPEIAGAGGVLEHHKQKLPKEWRYVICTYDLAIRVDVYRQLMAFPWNVMICDEAHQLGNEQSKRGKLVYGNLWDNITEKILLLSGSISRNSIEQLWAPWRRIAPDIIPPWNVFVDKYCGVTWEEFWKRNKSGKAVQCKRRRIRGAKNKAAVKELAALARSNFLIRRFKKDIDKDLPPKLFQTIRIDIPGGAKDTLEQLCREFREEVIEQALDTDRPDPAFSTAYRELGEAKVAACAAVTADLVAEAAPRPLIVFVYHRTVFHMANLLLGNDFNVVAYDPDLSSKVREAQVEQFQDGMGDIFLATYAGAEAITLTRSSTVVVWETAISRFQNEQAWDRPHRVGQKNQVEIKTILTESEIDNKVYTALRRKLREHEAAFG